MVAADRRAERGFSLVEVLIATAIFVFVALAGFEVVRQLNAAVVLLAQRAQAAAGINTTIAQMRSDSISATSVWVPNTAGCGNPAISMMRRDAAGISFTTYVLQAGVLERATGTGPIDPCNANGTVTFDTVLTNVTGMTATAVAASALAAEPDGALFTGAIPSVVVDAHERDFDGSTITTGNTLVEVALDADPATATVDLIAGNRPSGYILQLRYTCGARCQANTTASGGVFPEIASLSYTQCTIDPPDIPDAPNYYTASATGLSGSGRIVVTQYAMHLRYSYTFGGGASPPLTVYRAGPAFTWPAAQNLADTYPVDYTNNAVRTAGAAAIVPFAPPSGLATDDTVCTNMNGETDYGA